MSAAALVETVFSAAPAPASTVQTWDCCRCCTLAAEAEEAGFDPPPVAEAETWIGPNGRRYHAGLCRQCADIEWSETWDDRYERAAANQDQSERDRLQHRMLQRRDAGRRYWSAVERKSAGLTREEFKRASAKFQRRSA